MRVHNAIAASAALVITASVIWLVHDLHGTVPDTSVAAHRVRQLDTVDPMTEAITAQRSGRDQRVGAPAAPELPGPAATRSAEDAARPAPSRDERRQAALDAQRRAIAAFDAHMQGAEDRAWAGELRGQLVDACESGLAVQSVACRDSLCRADLTLDDPAAMQRFVDKFSSGAPRVFSLFYEREGGKLKTTLYLARPGTAMPDLRKELAARS